MKIYILYLYRYWLSGALFMVSFLSVMGILLLCDGSQPSCLEAADSEQKTESLEAVKPAIFEIKVHQKI